MIAAYTIGSATLNPFAMSRALSRGSNMVASETFADFLREQLAPLGRVTMRRMFGKTGVFCDGVMFAMVTENTLYFRVDEQNRATFKEAAGSVSAAQLCEAGADHRACVLARTGAAVRRTRRTDRVGASGIGGGTPGCGVARADGAKTKIEAIANRCSALSVRWRQRPRIDLRENSWRHNFNST